MHRLTTRWKQFRSQSIEQQTFQATIAALIVSIVALFVAFVAPIPWDLLKEKKGKQEQAEQQTKEDTKKQAELKERNAKQIKRLCDEFNKRYEFFQARIGVEDHSGAIRAFDTPAGRFTTTDAELNARDSQSLVKELLELSGRSMPPHLSQIQFDKSTTTAFIRQQVESVMDQVDKACKPSQAE
jgi:hypothetical protein